MRLAFWLGPDAPTGAGLEWWREEVASRTGGQVEVEIFYGGALLAGPDILGGVRDGLAELGVLGFGYYQGEMPLSNVAGIPYTTRNAAAQMRAFRELYEQSELYRQEFEAHNVEVMYFSPLSANLIGTTEPLRTLDDLQGQTIRGYAYINDALDIAGANAIAMDAGEIYESIERGVIDGWAGNALEVIPDIGLHEVTPYITDTGQGQYAAVAIAINKQEWDALPDDVRTAIQSVNDDATDQLISILSGYEDRACDRILEAGGEVSVLPDAEIERWRGLIGDTLNEKWIEDATRTVGDSDAVAGFFDQYHTILRAQEEATPYEQGVERCAAREG